MAEHVIVFTSVSSEEEGLRIARELVSRRLAACVSVTAPVRSVYVWKGDLREESERMLVIKTLRENFDRLRETVSKLHSYELPELIAVGVEAGEQTYLNWLTAHCTVEPSAG